MYTITQSATLTFALDRRKVPNIYDLIARSYEMRFWLHAFSKGALPLIALVGAVYTAAQFRRARDWRAGDLAQKLLSDLITDDELAFACQALDWAVGPITVPERYRPILSKRPIDLSYPTPRDLGQIIDHDVTLMSVALQVRLTTLYMKEPLYLVYRYCFDKLFSHLSHANRLVETKQVSISDLEGFKYWLTRIAVYEYPPSGITGVQMFQRFLTCPEFGYDGVINLGRRLNVIGWSEVQVQDLSHSELLSIKCE